VSRAALLAVMVGVVLAACRPDGTAVTDTPPVAGVAGPPATASAPAPAADAGPHEEGRRIYNFRCYYCHGYSGDARTLAATFLQPPPRNFQAMSGDALPREAMMRAVADGIDGSAMAGFRHALTPREIGLVVDFVRTEFVERKARNTAYHTAANGWPDHGRYRIAFPFARGEIPLDRPWDQLDASQSAGRRLYLAACVSCHDRARVDDEGRPWELRGVSYPPGNYEESHDGQAHGAAHDAAPQGPVDPYELHETPPALHRPSARVRRGERIYQRDCAHCHAADGTGRNWIGSFLEPHPPDLTAAPVRARLSRDLVVRVTRDGVPGTSMPSWRGVLRPAEIDAVSAYVIAAFVAPAPAGSPP